MGLEGSNTRPRYRISQIVAVVIMLVSFFGAVMYYNYTEVSWIGGQNICKTTLLSPSADETMISGKMAAHPIEEDPRQEEEYRARITRYQDVCAVRKTDVRSRRDVLYYNNPLTNCSLSFCAVPKTGTTFWRRIFQFLNRTSKTGNISSPVDLQRFQVYSHPLVKIHTMTYNDDLMTHALRFFFVRDPYARLMSAYVDKFILPQFLNWGLYSKIFAEKRANNSKMDNKPCVKIVTFAEFIERIVLMGDTNLHWQPVHRVCDPCKLFPRMIGKQETFSKDAKYILSKVGLQHLMTEYSHKMYVHDEIKQMVDFTYSYRNSNEYVRKCFDNADIASRIWRAFQMNGYLPRNMMFPISEMETLLKNNQGKIRAVKDAVMKIMVRTNARAGISRDQHSKQKRHMMVREFATLSRKTREKLAKRFDVDFRMFGYEKYPKDLFPWIRNM